MAAPLHAPWDIKLAGVGYVLAKAGPVDPETGQERPAFSEELIQYPASRQASGGQSYENWPPQVETAWVLRDLSGGFGQKIWKNGSNRYYYGFVDTRVPGQIIPSPELNSQAITAEDRIHYHFERTIGSTDTLFLCEGRYIKYLTDPASPTTSKDLGTGIIAKRAVNFQGVHDKLLTYVAVESSGGMPQPYWTYSGASVTTTWAQDATDSTVAPTAALYDDDGTFTEDSAAPMVLTLNSLVAADDAVYVRGDQPFAGIAVTFTNLNVNASVLTVKYYNGTAYTAVSGASDGTASGGASFGQAGSITFTLPTDWEIDEINSGTGYHIQLTWSADLDATVATTDIDLIQRDTAAFFEVHDNKLYRVAKTASGYKLSTSDDGSTEATWTAIGTITDLGNPVTAMTSGGSRLYITAESSLHVLAGDGATIEQEVWPHPRTLRDTYNGVGGSEWNGQFWAPSRFGLYAFRDVEGYIVINTEASPGRLVENDSPVKGKITCFAGDDFYGYAIMRNEADSKSFLLSYNADNNSWHPLLDLGNITSRHMWVSDVGHATNPLLYFAAGDDLRWIILPRNSPNPLQDSACRFDKVTTNVGQLYLGRFLTSFEFENKNWLTGKVMGEDWATGQTVKVEYRTTDDGSWSTLDTFDTDPVGEANFITSVASRFLEVRVTLATDDTSKLPILRTIYISHAIRYPFKRLFGIAVRLRSRGAMRGHVLSQKAVGTFKAALKTAISSSAPIEFIHIDKVETLDVIPLDYRVFTVENTESKDLEYIGFAELAEHAATVHGTWGRASALSWNQASAYTWAGIQEI